MISLKRNFIQDLKDQDLTNRMSGGIVMMKT